MEIGLGKARIGVRAPATVSVHRREIFDAIKAGAPARPPDHHGDSGTQGLEEAASVPGAVRRQLVLTRKKHESIMIGDDIEVSVVDIRESVVRMGFACPKDVPIRRRDAIREGTVTPGETCGAQRDHAGSGEPPVPHDEPEG
ncbi:MAG: carbon storage regulator [Planctomycetes bacterium]|nr:carbon storage regulator [Planctomycetota bacterium]